jgi:hypothetical protein
LALKRFGISVALVDAVQIATVQRSMESWQRPMLGLLTF